MLGRTRRRPLLALSALALSAALAVPAAADVTGKVTAEGNFPKPKEIKAISAVADCAKLHTDPIYEETYVIGEKGELKNVVVYVKKEEGQDLPGAAPAAPAVLDQSKCVYVPHVLPVMIGQKLQVKNSDPFLHNVHGLGRENGEFNFPQNKGDVKDLTGQYNKTAEPYKVKCDVHPWMSAWIVVVDNPYFGATGDDGTFKITGLKDGEYTLVAWHERLGTQEQKIAVKGGNATANFAFKPRTKASAEPKPGVDFQEVTVAELTGAPSDPKAAKPACCGNCEKSDPKATKPAEKVVKAKQN